MPEMIFQGLFLGGAVAVFKWFDLGFELSLLLLLVLGFSLTTLNIISSTVSQNVHLAEIRDLLLEQARGKSRPLGTSPRED